jgi:hypothetical protein
MRLPCRRARPLATLNRLPRRLARRASPIDASATGTRPPVRHADSAFPSLSSPCIAPRLPVLPQRAQRRASSLLKSTLHPRPMAWVLVPKSTGRSRPTTRPVRVQHHVSPASNNAPLSHLTMCLACVQRRAFHASNGAPFTRPTARLSRVQRRAFHASNGAPRPRPMARVIYDQQGPPSAPSSTFSGL